MHTHQKSSDPVATIGFDIGKNTFHLAGLDKRGTIALRIKVSRSQLVRRLVNLPPCLVVGMLPSLHRVGTRLSARLCRGRHLRRLSSRPAYRTSYTSPRKD
jgi:hypothetical protein